MEKENNNNNNNMFLSSFFKPNWDHPMDQTDPFESALSSMVSSPTASTANANGENIVLRELIGRLGSICNSGEISPQPNYNTSCYSTPLNSPPKLNLSMENQRQIHFPPFSADPAFAERAARFSCFAGKEMPPNLDSGKISRVSGSQIAGSHPTVQENWDGISKFAPPENGDSRENSSVSEQIPQNDAGSRKRKSTPKGKGKETPAKDANVAAASENSESSAKRSKSEEEEKDVGKGNQKQSKENPKAAEAPKDYIHVRARRGQATDAHSLAERVRREKISERMKVLQDLVPGCNKVTGKAVMLDEIINYVQSLQRQVEFLSMKLSTVNPRMDYNMEALMSSKDSAYPSDSYPFQSQQNGMPEQPFMNAAALPANQFDNFTQTASQVSSAFWEDDLHSIVQMGFGQNQSFQGMMGAGEMKVEL